MAEPRFACQTPEFMLSPWVGRRQIACTDYNPLIRHVCPKDGISRQITSTHYNRLPVDIGQCYGTAHRRNKGTGRNTWKDLYCKNWNQVTGSRVIHCSKTWEKRVSHFVVWKLGRSACVGIMSAVLRWEAPLERCCVFHLWGCISITNTSWHMTFHALPWTVLYLWLLCTVRPLCLKSEVDLHEKYCSTVFMLSAHW